MIRSRNNIISIILAAIFTAGTAFAQNKAPIENTRILIVLDASGSMTAIWGNSGRNQMEVAKAALKEIAEAVDGYPNIEIALRVYGHRSTFNMRDCTDSKLEVPFSTKANLQILQKLDQIRPRGVTPIAYSLTEAAKDFPASPGRNIVILMTDGEETCGGDPCKVALDLESKGIVLKHFVIGMAMSNEALEKVKCIGTLFNASDPSSLAGILKSVVDRIVSQTSLQVNLLDSQKKPSETDIALTFYDDEQHKARVNIFHTFDHRGQSDTLFFDPVLNYKMTVHTIPPVKDQRVELKLNAHNVKDVPVPQGTLEILMQGSSVNQNLRTKIRCLIKPSGSNEIIHVQDFNTSEKYLVGKYDIEFLTLPRKSVTGIEISQSKTTTLQMPQPGIANILKRADVYGGIFVMESGKLVKIYDLRPGGSESVALMPGTYTVIWRQRSARSMNSSQERVFEISSGSSISINL